MCGARIQSNGNGFRDSTKLSKGDLLLQLKSNKWKLRTDKEKAGYCSIPLCPLSQVAAAGPGTPGGDGCLSGDLSLFTPSEKQSKSPAANKMVTETCLIGVPLPRRSLVTWSRWLASVFSLQFFFSKMRRRRYWKNAARLWIVSLIFNFGYRNLSADAHEMMEWDTYVGGLERKMRTQQTDATGVDNKK